MEKLLNVKELGYKVVLDNFTHMKGNHCETTSLMKVLNHMGHPFEEEFLFGLAGGVGFVNWYSKGMQNPFLGGRNGKFPYFTNKMCSRLNVDIEIATTSSINKSEIKVLELLSMGKPVIVYGDIAKLPYFKSNSHFGQHAFVVYGINYNEGLVYISDRGGKPQTINLDTYRVAHSTKCKPYSPNNAVLVVNDIKADDVDMKNVVVESILDACNEMLHPPIKKFGVEGMRAWANEVSNFSTVHSELDTVSYLISTFINIETAGTGGKAFRSMYSRYLNIAKNITNIKQLAEMSERFSHSANLWRNISNALLNREYFGNISTLILKKEEIFMSEGTIDCKEGSEVDREFKEAIVEANKNVDNIIKSLPSVGDEVLKCYEVEKTLYLDLVKILT